MSYDESRKILITIGSDRTIKVNNKNSENMVSYFFFLFKIWDMSEILSL